MAYPKSHNPFADDDEEDFKPKSRGFDDDPCDSGMSEAERRQRYLQQEVMRTAQSAVDSSHRSLSLIYESEKMGVETAEVCQSIQLYHSTQRSSLSLEKGENQQKKFLEFSHSLCLSLTNCLSLSLSGFVSVGAGATGWGSEEDRQDVGQHGSGPEDQPEAHYQYQECVGRPCQLLQRQARDKATTRAARSLPGQWQVRFSVV